MCNQMARNTIKVAYAFVISRIVVVCSALLGWVLLGLHLHGKIWVLHPALATVCLGRGGLGMLLLGMNMFRRAAVKCGNAV